MTCLIGAAGLRQPALWRKLPLIPLWDALALAIWLLSFGRDTIRWRDAEYRISGGELIPVAAAAGEPQNVTSAH